MIKRWLVVLGVLSLLFLVAGCKPEVSNQAEIPENIPTPPASPAKSPETLVGQGISTGISCNLKTL